MRIAIEGIKVAAIAVAICVVFAGQASAGQYADGIREYGDLCPTMLHANAADMVQFLNTVKPDDSNKYCVAYFMFSLGAARYQPAIPALIKLLDFRTPQPPPQEGQYIVAGPRVAFAAAEALWEIGRTNVLDADPSAKEKVLSALLGAIEDQSTSSTAQELATTTWMEICQFSPDGIARLKREEKKATDSAVKQRLDAAIQRAMPRCAMSWTPPEKAAACRQAAETGTVPDQAPPTQQ